MGKADQPAVSEGYGVIQRLMELRNLLLGDPQSLQDIVSHFPGTYLEESGKRRLRRDLQNLGVLGYTLQRSGRPVRWQITAGPCLLADEDVDALVHVRDAFAEGHPHALAVQRCLDKLTTNLSPEQSKRWRRRPALRVPLKPAIDYDHCAWLIQWLEAAIGKRQQIAFWYRPTTRDTQVWHAHLDPYEIEFTDGHFYLLAFEHEYGTFPVFRIDRIVQDNARRSPELLPSMQLPRRERKPIHFTYRLPAAFADSGVSEHFTIHAIHRDEQYVTVEASDPSEFKIVRVLLAYGENALLLSGPTTLMERMREKVRLTAEQYG